MGDLLYLEFVSRIIQGNCDESEYADIFSKLEQSKAFLMARDRFFEKKKRKSEKILKKEILKG
jgi:predicted phosphodiesterase